MVLRRGRMGRPGLLGAVARTAVISGTATATSNAVNRRSQQRAGEPRVYAAQEPGRSPESQTYPPAPAAAGPGDSENLVTQLRSLGELHTSGVLSDEEFAAAKRQLLG
ncbi:SHOCT domain-containing protein [Dietzia sp. NPDC055877]